MASYATVKELFVAICDAIRYKDGTTGLINHQEIPARIEAIPQEGGGGGWDDDTETEMHKNDEYVRILVDGPAFGFYVSQLSKTSDWIDIDWGDGTQDYITQATFGREGVLEHFFETAGKHIIKIRDSEYRSTSRTIRLYLTGVTQIGQSNTAISKHVVRDYATCVEYIANSEYENTTSLISFVGTSVKKLVTYLANASEISYSRDLETIEYLGFAGTSSVIGQSGKDATHLKKVIFPETNFSLIANAFDKCALTELDFSDKPLTGVSNNVFQNDYYLTSLVFPDTLQEMGQGASGVCRYCLNLEKVRLPENANITYLGANFFTFAVQLGHVTLPANYREIGSQAFSSSGITSLLILKTDGVVTGGSGMFTSGRMITDQGCIYVPDSLVADYKSATNWSTYSSYIKGWSEAPEGSDAYQELQDRGLI